MSLQSRPNHSKHLSSGRSFVFTKAANTGTHGIMHLWNMPNDNLRMHFVLLLPILHRSPDSVNPQSQHLCTLN